VLLCFNPRVRRIRNEASSCLGIFSRTLHLYYVAISPGSPLPHLLDWHRKLVGCSAIPTRSLSWEQELVVSNIVGVLVSRVARGHFPSYSRRSPELSKNSGLTKSGKRPCSKLFWKYMRDQGIRLTLGRVVHLNLVSKSPGTSFQIWWHCCHREHGRLFVYVCVWVYVCVRVCVCVYVNLSVRVCVCVRVCKSERESARACARNRDTQRQRKGR